MSWRALAGSCVLGLIFALSTAMLHAADEPSADYVQLIVKTIRDHDREFRAAGLEQVRHAAPGPEFTKLFVSLLPNLDADGQIALLNALADRGDHAARPAVLQYSASGSNENVRAAAIGALGQLGELDDLPLLIKNLSTSSAVERSAARLSLTQISGKEINSAIAAKSKLGPPDVRATLLDVLATRRASDELATLIAATVDDEVEVRRAAMAALGQIGTAEQLAKLLPGVLKAEKGSERDDAERNVALICSRMDDESQRGNALIDALKTVDVEQQDQLLSLVGRVGGPRLINYVAEIATGKDVSRRRLGIDALSKWPDASVADKLLEIVNQATDPAERRQAFQGYVKVSSTRDGRSDKERLDRMKQAMSVAKTPEEVTTVINRTRTAYDIDSLRFALPYVSQAPFAQIACETIVEIAHHREVRDPNKAEVDKMLDKVIATSKDPEVIDRAKRYKRGETWTRPAKK